LWCRFKEYVYIYTNLRMETDLRLLGGQMLAPAVFWDVFVQGKSVVFFKTDS
jgi:hypothetical protein